MAMGVIGIKYPELMTVKDRDGAQTTGGDQHWYPKEGYIPPGACGATASSNALAYVLRSRPRLYGLAAAGGLDGLAGPVPGPVHEPVTGQESAANATGIESNTVTEAGSNTVTETGPNTKDGYLEFMKKVYRFMYPRIGGLMSGDFLTGMGELSGEYGLPFETERLPIPISLAKRPAIAEVCSFIGDSLKDDIPVAFLILSNGCVEKLDTWHWVTILAIDEETRHVQIVDNCEVFWADLGMWLDTSIMGGAFVRLRVCA